MLSVYLWNIYIDSLLTEAPAPEFLNKILNRFRLRLLIFSQLLGIFNFKKMKSNWFSVHLCLPKVVNSTTEENKQVQTKMSLKRQCHEIFDPYFWLKAFFLGY